MARHGDEDAGNANPETADRLTGQHDRGGDPRVLLFVHGDRDRDLLVEALSDRYAVEAAVDRDSLDDPFDCCVLDERAFSRIGDAIEARRERAEPSFLPFVLLASDGGTAGGPRERVWECVDDVIELPTRRRALVSRIANLIERRETSLQLSETVEELRLKERALDEAPVGITVAESGGDDNPLVYLNEEFERLTGYGPEKLGMDCRFLQGEDTSEETTAAIRAAIDDERPVSVDVLNYRANGRKFWNRLTVAPIRDETETVTHYVGFQSDITDRKIRERRLEVMARVLNHNLRNKMNLIEGYTELLRDGVEDDANRRHLDVIAETSDDLMGIARAARKIDDTLSGGERRTPVSLRDHLIELSDRVRSRYPDASVSLSLPTNDPLEVRAVGLTTAVDEAVENALKHNDGPNPTVEVRVDRPSPDWLAVEIEDDGPGIPDHEIHVLEEGETSLDHADRLGMWLMYWVVARAGGEFEVDSGPEGTVIRMEVPVDP